MNRLKKMFDDVKGKWVEELPHDLWTYQTTLRRLTGETPFFHDLWVQDCDPSKDWISNIKDELVHSRQ